MVVKNRSELSIHVCSVHMLCDMSVSHIEDSIVTTFGASSMKQSDNCATIGHCIEIIFVHDSTKFHQITE